MTNVKFKYVRSGMSSKDRVLTVAYTVHDGAVSVGYSMNRPETWEKDSWPDCITYNKIQGDTFSKKKGRMIASGRLENTPITAPMKGSRPLVAALSALRDATKSKHVRNLCDKELLAMDRASQKQERHA